MEYTYGVVWADRPGYVDMCRTRAAAEAVVAMFEGQYVGTVVEVEGM